MLTVNDLDGDPIYYLGCQCDTGKIKLLEFDTSSQLGTDTTEEQLGYYLFFKGDFLARKAGKSNISFTFTDIVDTTHEKVEVNCVENQPPVANFILQVSSSKGGTQAPATIMAVDQSYDPENDPIHRIWQIVYAPLGAPAESLEIEDSLQLSFYYPSAGKVIYTLTCIDQRGAQDSLSKTVYLYNRPPVAKLTLSPEVGYTPFSLLIQSQSYDPDGQPIIEYYYEIKYVDFDTLIITSDPSYTYKFSRAVGERGNWHYAKVFLNCKDIGLALSETTAVGSCLVCGSPPRAIIMPPSFTYNSAPPDTGVVVTFYADSSYDPDGTITEYMFWVEVPSSGSKQKPKGRKSSILGDVMPLNLKKSKDKPQFYKFKKGSNDTLLTFYRKGTYYVYLVVKDDQDLSDTTYATVRLANNPPRISEAGWSYEDGSPILQQHIVPAKLNYSFKLIDRDLDKVYLTIDFGDGTRIAKYYDLSQTNGELIIEGSYTYNGKTDTIYIDTATGDTYTYRFFVEADDGIARTTFDFTPVRLKNCPPFARFVTDTNEKPHPCKFLLLSTATDTNGYITQYKWIALDTIGQGEKFTLSCDTPGKYPVTLWVWDNEGDSSFVTDTFTAYNIRPSAKLSIERRSTDLPCPVLLNPLASRDPNGDVLHYYYNMQVEGLGVTQWLDTVEKADTFYITGGGNNLIIYDDDTCVIVVKQWTENPISTQLIVYDDFGGKDTLSANITGLNTPPQFTLVYWDWVDTVERTKPHIVPAKMYVRCHMNDLDGDTCILRMYSDKGDTAVYESKIYDTVRFYYTYNGRTDTSYSFGAYTGTYRVYLTLSDGQSVTDTELIPVRLENCPPFARLTFDKDSMPHPYTFTLTDNSSDTNGYVVKRKWIGVTGNDTAKTTTLLLDTPATHTVTLWVWDNEGDSGYVTHTFCAYNLPPTPAFSWALTQANLPIPMLLDMRASSDPNGDNLFVRYEFYKDSLGGTIYPASEWYKSASACDSVKISGEGFVQVYDHDTCFVTIDTTWDKSPIWIFAYIYDEYDTMSLTKDKVVYGNSPPVMVSGGWHWLSDPPDPLNKKVVPDSFHYEIVYRDYDDDTITINFDFGFTMFETTLVKTKDQDTLCDKYIINTAGGTYPFKVTLNDGEATKTYYLDSIKVKNAPPRVKVELVSSGAYPCYYYYHATAWDTNGYITKYKWVKPPELDSPPRPDDEATCSIYVDTAINTYIKCWVWDNEGDSAWDTAQLVSENGAPTPGFVVQYRAMLPCTVFIFPTAEDPNNDPIREYYYIKGKTTPYFVHPDSSPPEAEAYMYFDRPCTLVDTAWGSFYIYQYVKDCYGAQSPTCSTKINLENKLYIKPTTEKQKIKANALDRFFKSKDTLIENNEILLELDGSIKGRSKYIPNVLSNASTKYSSSVCCSTGSKIKLKLNYFYANPSDSVFLAVTEKNKDSIYFAQMSHSNDYGRGTCSLYVLVNDTVERSLYFTIFARGGADTNLSHLCLTTDSTWYKITIRPQQPKYELIPIFNPDQIVVEACTTTLFVNKKGYTRTIYYDSIKIDTLNPACFTEKDIKTEWRHKYRLIDTVPDTLFVSNLVPDQYLFFEYKIKDNWERIFECQSKVGVRNRAPYGDNDSLVTCSLYYDDGYLCDTMYYWATVSDSDEIDDGSRILLYGQHAFDGFIFKAKPSNAVNGKIFLSNN
ncbi:hypothetical protein DRN74_05140, partial [Candidatus Micrarchaeota archaeon]